MTRSTLVLDAIRRAGNQLTTIAPANGPSTEPALRYGDFIRQAWRVLEPATPYEHNWHIDAIAEHLEAVTVGQIPRLLINIPPRHTKSTLVSVFWPAWVWTFRPATRWLCASYKEDLAIRDSTRSRRIIDSLWYQQHWAGVFQLATDQNQKSRFENTRSGQRIAVSIGGSSIGEGGDFLIIDDPHDPQKVESDIERASKRDWFDLVWSTRLNDPRAGGMVMVMQRVHHQDLSGHVLEQGGWVHLRLPSEFEVSTRCVTVPLHGQAEPWADPRRSEGELLFPERFSPEVIAAAKRRNAYAFAGQHQQRPSPKQGSIWQRGWWRWYHSAACGHAVELAERRPERFEEMLLSWDCAFKDLDSSDYVVGQVWARRGADVYLLDQVRQRMSFTETVKEFTNQVSKWPEAVAKLIEDKANGTAVIDTLRRRVPGLIPVEPEGGKVARAQAVAPLIEAGNVWLPCQELAPWIGEALEEFSAFPTGANDDQVDAASQALRRFAVQPAAIAAPDLLQETAWSRF